MTIGVILAAGHGERLEPYTSSAPKCMLRLGGHSVLSRAVAAIRRAKVEEIFVIRGQHGTAVHVDGVRYIDTGPTANMFETLLMARNILLSGEDILVVYADILFDTKIVVTLLEEAASPVAVAVDVNWLDLYSLRSSNPFSLAESCIYTSDRHIEDIGRPRPNKNEVYAQYIGLLNFTVIGAQALVSIWDEINMPRQITGGLTRSAYMTDVLMALVHRSVPVQAVEVSGGWYELDTVEDYETAIRLVRNGEFRRLVKDFDQTLP